MPDGTHGWTELIGPFAASFSFKFSAGTRAPVSDEEPFRTLAGVVETLSCMRADDLLLDHAGSS